MTFLHLLDEARACLAFSPHFQFSPKAALALLLTGCPAGRGAPLESWLSNTGTIQEQGSWEQKVACALRPSFTVMAGMGITTLMGY